MMRTDAARGKRAALAQALNDASERCQEARATLRRREWEFSKAREELAQFDEEERRNKPQRGAGL